MVAEQVNVALGAAAEALLDTVRAGVAEARELRDTELPANCAGVKRLKWLDSRRLRIGPTGLARACDATRSQSPSAASSGPIFFIPEGKTV